MHCWKNTRSRKLGIWKHWEIPSAGKLIWIRVLGIRWKMKRSKKKKRKAEWNAETNCQHWHRGHSARDFAKWWSKHEKSFSWKRKFVKKIGNSETRSKTSTKPYTFWLSFTLHWRIAKWHRKAEPYIPRLAFTKVICVCLHRYQARILTPCWRFVE